VADAEVVAFVDAEPLELDAALALARPVKPARITPLPTPPPRASAALGISLCAFHPQKYRLGIIDG
jgi:hypothetical protein